MEEDRSDKLTPYERLSQKYGEHEAIWVDYNCVNGYGLTNPKFTQKFFARNPQELEPRIRRATEPRQAEVLPYDSLPPLLLAKLLQGNIHSFRRNEEVGGGNPCLTTTDHAIKLGGGSYIFDTEGQSNQDALSFKVIAVSVDTNIHPEDLSQLGL